jgi:hypothetical protein
MDTGVRSGGYVVIWRGVISVMLGWCTVAAAYEGGSVVKVAESYTYVREHTGHNDAPEIDKFLAYAGVPRGLPYCLAFGVYAWGQVYKQNPYPRLAGTVRFLEVVKQHPLRYKIYTAKDLKVSSSQTLRGAIGIYTHNSRTGHAFITDCVVNSTTFSTIEGNTVGKRTQNVQEQRGEGSTTLRQGVHRRVRTVDKEGMQFKGIVVPR